MSFIETIVEKENKVLSELKKCLESGYPTYILGNGEGADNIEKRAKDFKFNGRLVNKKFFKKADKVYCLEEVLDNTDEKINVIVGYRGFNETTLQNWKDKINIIIDMDFWAGNCFVDSSLMTYSFVEKNVDKLNEVYDGVEDEYSRKVLSAYINQKISSDYKYLKKVKTTPQYFENAIISLDENETFVDCGAFDGDSAAAFIKELNIRGIKKYNKIISFEPDPSNYKKLISRNFINHICMNKGTSDMKGELLFSSSGTSSGISDRGEITVELDQLDNMINEKISYLKMDIEGAELASLKGAKNLIVKYRPKLAICIYHKKEDLWEIYSYIKSLIPQYRFYIRVYEDTATELVLYAV